MNKENNFKRELPDGYIVAKQIDATKGAFAVVFNIIAFVIMGAIIALGFGIRSLAGVELVGEPIDVIIAYGLLMVGFLAYIVLHELTHGFVYKAMTGEKLTFGITLTCAFCGVPNIYVSRKTALLASLAPLAIYTVILLPLTVLSLFYFPVYFIPLIILFAGHFGGCVGDMYVILLLLFKYKDESTLVRDTGPAQFFCVKADT